MQIGNGQFLLGDCFDLLRSIPDGSVDMVLTSPPYDNLRTYNDSLVWDFNVFTNIANELSRVICNGGVIVWVVGDATVKGSETGSSFRQALYFMEHCGLNLHDTMIWNKGGFSAIRYHQTFEYMFVFSKGKPKTFNPLKDRVNICAGKVGSQGKNTYTNQDGSKSERKTLVNTEYGQRHNVWDINTSGQMREMVKHPAPFPTPLAIGHIISWSNQSDTILDPFAGSGTTAVAAERTGRKWICMEKQPEYYYPALARVMREQQR